MLDDDAVIADVGERDVLIYNCGDGAGRLVDGLDSNTVLGVSHCGGRDGNVFYGVVASASDGADGEAMAAGAVSACEGDTLFEELEIVHD